MVSERLIDRRAWKPVFEDAAAEVAREAIRAITPDLGDGRGTQASSGPGRVLGVQRGGVPEADALMIWGSDA